MVPPVSSDAVMTENAPSTEYGFSLGSNLGDRLAHLAAARDALAALPGLDLVAQSAAYETSPVGVKPEHEDKPFLNSVVILRGTLSVAEVMAALGRIETELGRERGGDRFAPRTVDVDLLYAGDQIIDSGGVTVPHPRWAKRRFVVQPLADLRPDLVLPGAGLPVRALLDTLPPGETATVFAAVW